MRRLITLVAVLAGVVAAQLAVPGTGLAQDAGQGAGQDAGQGAGQGAATETAPGAGDPDQTAPAQTAPDQTAPDQTALATGTAASGSGIDYDEWDRDATSAEDVLEKDRASTAALEQMRARIVVWRTRLSEAQSANQSRIATLREQISALGPAPAEGATEAGEIAARRAQLNDQLGVLQAPGLAAVEAYSRADGIIRQIDSRIRERQADALLKLSPSPLNPVNWPAGYAVLQQGMKTLGREVAQAWSTDSGRATLRNNLPAIILYLLVAAVLMGRAPQFIERQTMRLQARLSPRVRYLASGLLSLGQVIVPVGGMMLVVLAVAASGMAGQRTQALFNALPLAAFSFFAARWLGSWLFPRTDTANAGSGIALSDRRIEGRFHANAIGLVMAAEVFRRAFITEVRPPLSQAAQAVWATPVALVLALFLFRLGMLLRSHQRAQAVEGEAVLFRNRMLSFTGGAVAAVSVVAPLLAAVGYVAAADALIWPTALSVGLIGLLIILQRFLTDIYLGITGTGEEGREALIPVLLGVALTLAALPVFALIWGARTADLSEVWTRFGEGIPLGQTRISPAVFLTLIAVFAAGYMATRAVQGALRSSVLPRTRLDKGAQNALVAGLGYLGLILSALFAVTTAGIDLSSLAIVAGALSLGLGFGLQNIVQNFVSGVILLIERPVSEGDWIEVGGQQGIVKAISVRSTRIETFDRIDVIVPNGDLIAGQVRNWTRFSPTGRVLVPVTVAFGSDTRLVEKILTDIAEAQPQVMLTPPPVISFADFLADGLRFELIAFIPDVTLGGGVRSEIRHQIIERFAEAGILSPAQQREATAKAKDLLAPPPPAIPDPAAPPAPGVS